MKMHQDRPRLQTAGFIFLQPIRLFQITDFPCTRLDMLPDSVQTITAVCDKLNGNTNKQTLGHYDNNNGEQKKAGRRPGIFIDPFRSVLVSHCCFIQSVPCSVKIEVATELCFVLAILPT